MDNIRLAADAVPRLRSGRKFDIKNARHIGEAGEKIFLIDGDNRETADRDILLLSDIFAASHKAEPDFPLFRIYSDDIRFDYHDALEPRLYCHLEVYEKTAEDSADYDLILHFCVTPDAKNIILGDIYYFEDGSIGKYNVRFEHENDIFYVFCRRNGDKIEIFNIIRSAGKRKKRFYPLILIGSRAAYFISGVLILLAVASFMTAFYIYDKASEKNDIIRVISRPEDESPAANEAVRQTYQSESIETAGRKETEQAARQDQTEETAARTDPLLLNAEINASETEITINSENAVSVTEPPENTADETKPLPLLTTETAAETEPPETEAVQNEIKLVSVTSPAKKGSVAAVKIIGKPSVSYSIAVYYSSGKSSASGLEDKTADGEGYAEWSWKIGSRTKTGTYKIEVTGGGNLLKTEITITE